MKVISFYPQCVGFQAIGWCCSKLCINHAKSCNHMFIVMMSASEVKMHNFLSDRYDALTGTGMFAESHVKEDCLTELIRIVKPGMRIWAPHPNIAFAVSVRKLERYCVYFVLADAFDLLNLPDEIVTITFFLTPMIFECCVWHYMMTSSNGNISALLVICAGNSPANPPHKGQWRGALMFFLLTPEQTVG